MLEPKQEFINLRVNKCKEALEKQHIRKQRRSQSAGKQFN